MEDLYREQARLMLEMVPWVMRNEDFAIKGGSAINFFLRDVPRLSVDIDITYLPVADRGSSLQAISEALLAVKKAALNSYPTLHVREKRIAGGHCVSLFISNGEVTVTVETNTILRGGVFPAQQRELSAAAGARLGLDVYVSARTLSFGDLYAGKLMAALDRQHPRDIFDVKILLESEGLTDEIRTALPVYLASHNRPMHELLAPRPANFSKVFVEEFAGMTAEPVTVGELIYVRERLFAMIPGILNDSQRRFLLSMKAGDPAWDLLGIEGVEKLPALQWKLRNIRGMESGKRAAAYERLRAVLDM
ncbi:MAG: nucleotidyl transferase AbiEii/AbiGii toxin family protein [Chitinivibrionales bacterium]|nr:nucleotidyl transferase AbiEii/AbiGii toxin family protein [Chitinivibrionales bacterium]